MNLALWTAAALLAVVALTGGITKTFVSKDTLAAFHGGGWTGDVGVGFVKTLGVLELLAALGLILPAALAVAPVLVPVTAVCKSGERTSSLGPTPRVYRRTSWSESVNTVARAAIEPDRMIQNSTQPHRNPAHRP